MPLWAEIDLGHTFHSKACAHFAAQKLNHLLRITSFNRA
ncbi:hypothetical protein SOHN41_00362 [Shewanella sp. HN-41]|nr:hypothetical protein SOHN41_00362 [Shewanella sp. HN-41]